MTLRVEVQTGGWSAAFDREQAIGLGRARTNDVWVGRDLVHGRFTVSKRHAELGWDGTRWQVVNVSDKPGLLRVYEPGFEEVPIEPGRPWVAVRRRWGLSFGQPDHPFHVVCDTDDHVLAPRAAPTGNDLATVSSGVFGAFAEDEPVGDDDEPTILVDPIVHVGFTALELEVLRAYYDDFTRLPRPAVLEPRQHDVVARRLGRTKDSVRKAVARANAKIAAEPGAPAIATGRNVSGEIARWLVRTGLLDDAGLDR